MRTFLRGVLLVSVSILLPAAAFAQASIAGTARDTSGAVLPGVSVEASSPALIEKVRTGVTDDRPAYPSPSCRLVGGSYTAFHSGVVASAFRLR